MVWWPMKCSRTTKEHATLVLYGRGSETAFHRHHCRAKRSLVRCLLIISIHRTEFTMSRSITPVHRGSAFSPHRTEISFLKRRRKSSKLRRFGHHRSIGHHGSIRHWTEVSVVHMLILPDHYWSMSHVGNRAIVYIHHRSWSMELISTPSKIVVHWSKSRLIHRSIWRFHHWSEAH